jgi:hypothetical protein
VNRIGRRNFIHGVGLAAGAAAASTLIESPQSLATDSSIPVAISGTILSLKNGVANENSLIMPAAMITILCQPQ